MPSNCSTVFQALHSLWPLWRGLSHLSLHWKPAVDLHKTENCSKANYHQTAAPPDMAANTASFRRLPDLQITEEEWDQPLPLFAEAAGAFSNGMKCATPCYRVDEDLCSLVVCSE